MAATITIDDDGRGVAGDRFVRRGTINLGAYATGGVTVSKGDFELPVSLDDLDVRSAAGYSFEYDKTNGKVKAYWPRIGLSTREVGVTDDDSAASNGVAVYAHIDETLEQGSYLAHLECVTAGNADSYFRCYDGGPTVAIQDDDAAATGGFAVYFDEDGTDGFRLLADMDRPADANVYVMCSDGSFLLIDDTDTPSTPGVQVYFDDDGATDTARLLFVSPTNTDGTCLMHEVGGEVADETSLTGITARFRAEGK